MKKLFLFFISLFSILYAEPVKTPSHLFSFRNPNYRDHPGDYPFPTDMTFRKYSDHVIDQLTEYFDPDVVGKGDLIYLTDWYISWFIKYIHPKIKYPYILISSDTDWEHPDRGGWDYNEAYAWPPHTEAPRTLLYDSKVAAWFCKNMIISRHPKIIQIPVGQHLLYWGLFKDHKEDYLIELSQKAELNKKHLLYMNMQLPSHPSRPVIAKHFQDKSFCFKGVYTFMRELYYNELAQSFFTLAPPGYGVDTIRFWEAIVLDCIPVVRHCELDDLYADLPVLFVDEWEDITEGLLKREYTKINRTNKEKVYFDYWLKKIKDVQAKVREDRNEFSHVEATQFPPDTLENLYHVLKASPFKQVYLLCRGAVLGLRPLEIAQKCPFISSIYVQDPWGAWGHETAVNHLAQFTSSPLLRQQDRVLAFNYHEDPFFVSWQESDFRVHVFFDLTYLRHRLKEDLEYFYPKAVSGAIICGNMATDPYVQKILLKFAHKYQLNMNFNSDIWSFQK